MRTCKDCGQTKPLTEFYKSNKKGNYHPRCKPCHVKKVQSVYTKEKGRDKNLRSNYGITLEQYNVMLVEQNHQCKVCGTTDPGGRQAGRGGSADVMCVDHCHKTGRIRGLLCHDCNRCLGILKEDVTRLRNMIKYIET